MANPKTTKNDKSVDAFVDTIDDEQKRRESRVLLELMHEVTGEPPVMWGDSIIGFGSYHYTYASGREGDWMLTGFSPRKRAFSIYIMSGFDPHDDLMADLGTFKTGKSCLYVKRLEDIDLDVLRALIVASTRYLTERYGPG